MLRLNELYGRFHHLILYGIFGLVASSLDFFIYTILVEMAGWNYLLANCMSIMVGLTTSFTLNRNYNFKVKDKTKRRFALFVMVGLTGLLLSNIILWYAIEHLTVDKLLAKLMSIVMVVFFQFLANKYVTFKTTNKHE